MSKRLIIGAIFSVLVLVILVVSVIGLITGKRERLMITPRVIDEINYNNYICENYLDYKGAQFAWLKPNLSGGELDLVDNNSRHDYFKEISAPFQINNDQIFYLSNHELFLRYVDTKKTAKIAKGVDSFTVYQNYIIYSSVRNFDDHLGRWMNNLYIYDLRTKRSKVIYENVTQFYIHRGKLFVINDEDWLVEISFGDYTAKDILKVQTGRYPIFVMPQGDCLLYMNSNQLNFLDLNTKDIKTISIVDSEYANNRINYICDEEDIFLSFQATKSNGSIVTDIDDENNGLWAIDTKTLGKGKICSDVFDRLYLFNGDQLFGTRDSSLYKIDIETKKVVKISD